MADWTQHPEVSAIPDVTAECDAAHPDGAWRIFQYGKPCQQECDAVRKKRSKDWPQIVAIMHKLAMTGKIHNKEQFRREFENVFAVKSRRGIRALGILESRGDTGGKPVFVVLTWFKKQRKSLNKDQIARVKDRRKQFETFVTEQCDEN